MIKVIVNDVLLDLKSDAVIALTRKVADIGTLQSRFSSFTNKFQVKATKKNRDALGIKQYQDTSDSISAGIATPYQELTGKLISNGIEIATNVSVIIESVAEDITLSIRAGNGSLFDKLNRTKLSDIDFSDVNHKWTASVIESNYQNDYTDTFVYPLFQNNNQSTIYSVVQAMGLIPFVFVKAIYLRIANLFGYNWAGDTFTSGFFEKLMLAISDTKISKSFADTLGVSRGMLGSTFNGSLTSEVSVNLGFNGGTDKWLLSVTQQNSQVTPFVFITSQTGIGSLSDGYYVPLDGTYRMTFNYNVNITSKVVNGSHYFRLIVHKRKGLQIVKTIALKTFPLTTPAIDTLVNYQGTISMDFSVNIEDFNNYNQEKNEWVCACVQFVEDVPSPGYAIFTLIGNSVVIEPLAIERTYYGRPVSLGDHLPDWTIGKFIKEVGNLFGAIYDVDEFRKEIEITRLDEIATNRDEAIDWSDKLDLSTAHEITYIVDGIGKTTVWQWNDPSIYDFSVTILNEQLPESETYVKSDALFSIMQNVAADNIGVMGIPIWNDNNFRIQLDNKARFAIYRNLGITTTLTGRNIGYPDTGAFLNNYPAAYFDYDNSPYSLDWSRLYSEYYQGLFEPMTWYMNKVVADFKLNDLDIQSFKFKYPVYIKHFNRYFYVNEISEYTGKDQSTKCTLIAI